jgi:predicted Zn-dependent peptidase
VKRPSFALGWKDRPFGEDGPEALFRREVDVSLLADVVFGPTSELFTDLYRAGLIDESFSVRYACDATFAHAVAGGTTRDADLVSERLLEGISRWRQKGITWPELQRKRRKAHGQFVGLFDSLEGMATLFLMYRLKGINLFSYPDVLETTRLEEVNRAFGELFAPERVTVATVTPG